MKYIKLTLLYCIIFSFSPIFAQLRPGFQLWSSGFHTGVLANGYAPISMKNSAFNALSNPASSAYIYNTRIFGSGLLTSELDGGGSFGIATPTITKGTLYFGSQFLSFDGTIYNQIGYGKKVRSDLAFGLEGIIVAHPTSANKQIGGGWNTGILWSPQTTVKSKNNFGFFNPSLGFSWKTVFNPTSLVSNNSIPQMIFQLGFNADIFQLKNFSWNINSDFALGFTPLEKAGSLHLQTWLGLGTSITFWEMWSISVGTVLGNYGLGFGSNPVLPFTLGTSIGQELNNFSFRFAYGFGMNKFYSNAVDYQHSFSLELGVGGNKKKGILSQLTIKESLDNTSYISPNSDKIQDTVVIYPNISSDYDVQSWKLTIFNEAGHTVKSFQSENALKGSKFTAENFFINYFTSSSSDDLPNEIIWDGRDEQDKVVKDGIYYLYLSVRYNENQISSSPTNLVVVDTSPPSANISTPRNYLYLGDNPKESLQIFQDLSPDFWSASLVNEDSGSIVQEWSWAPNKLAKYNSWSLPNPENFSVSSGLYSYKLNSIDKSGNISEHTISNIVIEITNRQVFINGQDFSFSPNGDSFKDSVTFQSFFRGLTGLKKSRFVIYDEQRNTVLSSNLDISNLPSSITWDGKNDKGDIVRDGNYIVSVVNTYIDNKEIRSHDFVVNIDTEAPGFDLSAPSYSRFSPDGDGFNDSINFIFQAEDLHAVSNWTVFIKRNGEIIDSIKGNSMDGSISWSPKPSQKLKVGENINVELSIQDVLGNKRTVPIQTTKVDILTDAKDLNHILTTNIAYFAEGSSTLSGKIFPYLDEIWSYYKFFPQDELIIQSQAYFDETQGNETEAYRLAVQRADAIKEYLIQKGVQAQKISIQILTEDTKNRPQQQKLRQAKIYLKRN